MISNKQYQIGKVLGENNRRQIDMLKKQIARTPKRIPMAAPVGEKILFGELTDVDIPSGFKSGTMILWSFDDDNNPIISEGDPEDRVTVWDSFGGGLPGKSAETRTLVHAIKSSKNAKWIISQVCVVDATKSWLPAYP